LTNKLYIIGNGFDRHHGIPSDYKDFGAYLEKTDYETYQIIERYFPVNDQSWWQFEEMLAFFDTDTLIDDASNFLVSYGADDWSDSYHHDYQFELDSTVDAISSTMRRHFASWIRQLPIPKTQQLTNAIRVRIDPAAQFLNFNYTHTLQKTYCIDDAHILHIHGKADQPDSDIIIGHGWEREPEESLNHHINQEEADTRVIEGNRIVDDYFSQTFKPCEKIIAKNSLFFAGLNTVQEILIMGHSLADVDAPYFQEIINNINHATVKWTVSYHKDSTEAEERICALGIDQKHVEYKRLLQF
jgi:hypothetical protein|tara:strand:- start:9521 stop:10420 length:900 start_codon:yes stop_codon:yes gene_type:complete